MPNMKSGESKQAHSWQWDSHISPKYSQWLAENLEEVDQSVKQILKLIEEYGDSFANKGEMYHEKRPKLIAHVEEFYRIYCSLAERYDNLTGELRKNISSGLQMQSPGFSDSSHQGSPLLTPDKKVGPHKSGGQSLGFDLDLSSGGVTGSSDLSLKGSSESSSSPSSDSDSESFNSSINKHSESPVNVEVKGLHQVFIELEMELPGMEKKVQVNAEDNADGTLEVRESGAYEMLLGRIIEYEEKLRISNEKLQFSEEEIAKLKDELKKNESIIVFMNLKEADLEKAQQEIVMLETKLDAEKRQALELKERIVGYIGDVSDRDREIKGLNIALSDTQKSFALEKSKFLAEISNLSKERAFLKARLEELEIRNTSLENEIRQCESEKMEMIRLHDAKERSFKAELDERAIFVEALNKNLDALKLKSDMLMTEKDGFNAKVQTLVAEKHSRENRIKQLEEHVLQIDMEKSELSIGSESARRLVDELRLRAIELEKEVDRQRFVILDRAEEKREAIRQLCFSLEHYRSGYEELRQAFVGHKRRAVLGW